MFLCVGGNALLEKSACDAKGVSHSPYVPTVGTCQRWDRKQSVFPLPNGGKCQCRIHRSLHVGGLRLIRLNSAPHPGCCFHMLRRFLWDATAAITSNPPAQNIPTWLHRTPICHILCASNVLGLARLVSSLPLVEKTCPKICEVVFLLC